MCKNQMDPHALGRLPAEDQVLADCGPAYSEGDRPSWLHSIDEGSWTATPSGGSTRPVDPLAASGLRFELHQVCGEPLEEIDIGSDRSDGESTTWGPADALFAADMETTAALISNGRWRHSPEVGSLDRRLVDAEISSTLLHPIPNLEFKSRFELSFI